MITVSSLLEVQDLSFTYYKSMVFENVCLNLQEGEIGFLLGPNGSGKTTLLRCLAGWSFPKSGTITLMGEEFTGAKQKQRSQLCFVPDTPAFYDDLTAEEHIRFVLTASGKQDRAPYAQHLLEKFGLKENSKQLPSSYSRGMREKLALVIAFAARPHLLLLDEPYGPLDSNASTLLSEEILRASDEGTAVILSLHQQAPGLSSDTAWRLENSQLQQLESQEVFDVQLTQ